MERRYFVVGLSALVSGCATAAKKECSEPVTKEKETFERREVKQGNLEKTVNTTPLVESSKQVVPSVSWKDYIGFTNCCVYFPLIAALGIAGLSVLMYKLSGKK